jgi:hypothetical protein
VGSSLSWSVVEHSNPHLSKTEGLRHPEIQRRSFGWWERVRHLPDVYVGTTASLRREMERFLRLNDYGLVQLHPLREVVMTEFIPPSQRTLAEALDLSTEILRNLELSEIPLTNIALKASRLARLLNDFDSQKIMKYEAGGYPSAADGVTPEIWALATRSGRKFEYTDSTSKETKVAAFVEPIGQLEEEVRSAEASIAAARDPDRATGSDNPYVGFHLARGNQLERGMIRQRAMTAAERLASRRAFIYDYVLQKHYELKFSRIAGDVFTRIRERVDATIGDTIPGAIQRLSAVYENLDSENPEDWSNAVHSCRRILEELADAVFPATGEVRTSAENAGAPKP